MTTLRLAAALAGIICFAAGAARADEASEAKLQFELGQELYKQKRLPEAIDRFVASNRLVPNPNIVFNVASIYAALAKQAQRKHDAAKADAHYIEAYNWIETYLAFPLPDGERQDGVKLRDTIKPSVALVDVTSTPAGADIVIDREQLGSVGRTPRVVAVASGQHTVILKAAGWRTGNATVVVPRSGSVAVRVDLQRITGTLHVESVPPGAQIHVEGTGETLGTTPLTRAVAVGTLRVAISQAGYLDRSSDVVVADGGTTNLAITLQRAALTVATLSVTGTPASAVVRLDGRPVGAVPTSAGDLPPGHGRLEILAPNHQPWAGDIPLEAGGATRITVQLAPETKRRWAGWKWVGYGTGGALLLAGAVVGQMAKTAKDDFYETPSVDKRDHWESLNHSADALLISGAVTVTATALAHWLWPKPRSSSVDVTVAR